VTGSRAPVPYVPLPAAVVCGYPAYALALLLRQHLPGAMRDRAPERRAELEAMWRAVEGACQAWLDKQTGPPSSAIGTAEVPSALSSPSWSEVMTTKEVAELLKVSTRQVLNLAGRLGGHQARPAAPWLFPRADVLAYMDGRA